MNECIYFVKEKRENKKIVNDQYNYENENK